jgi:hypothetical protein
MTNSGNGKGNTRSFYLSFVIGHLSFVIFQTADFGDY